MTAVQAIPDTAFVTVNAEGLVLTAGGALARFGLEEVAHGADIHDHAPFLCGMLPTDELVELPLVQSNATGWIADVTIAPDAGGALILWRDSSSRHAAQQTTAQLRNSRAIARRHSQRRF